MKELTISKPSELSNFLQRSISQIRAALPIHLNPDRMVRLAVTCFSTNPALRKCTPQSILGSIIVASQLGLEPGINGQGYLVPYKNICTFVPGWQGLVGLLNNTCRATAWTGAVFEEDLWDFELGSNPRCRHVPGPNYGDPEKLIWAYAVGQVNGSQMPVVEAWPISRVWKHRDKHNKVGQQHYSYEHPEMYARKAVLLQVLKYMPRSIELNNAMQIANADLSGRYATMNEDGVVIEGESIVSEQEPSIAKTADRIEQTSPNEQASEQKSEADQVSPLQELKMFLESEGITLNQVEKICRQSHLIKGTMPIHSVEDLPQKAVNAILRDTTTFLDAVRSNNDA